MAGSTHQGNAILGPDGNGYIYHGDESHHGGIHRWKIEGLGTIAEQKPRSRSPVAGGKNNVLYGNGVPIVAMENALFLVTFAREKSPYSISAEKGKIRFTFGSYPPIRRRCLTRRAIGRSFAPFDFISGIRRDVQPRRRSRQHDFHAGPTALVLFK